MRIICRIILFLIVYCFIFLQAGDDDDCALVVMVLMHAKDGKRMLTYMEKKYYRHNVWWVGSESMTMSSVGGTTGTTGGTASGGSCVFPFTWKGVAHTKCTTADNDGVAWCYTAGDDKEWGNCGATPG